MTMTSTTHILFTSRDVGAAHQVKHIIRAFVREGFKASVVASQPAYDVFKEEGLNVELFALDKGEAFVPRRAPAEAVEGLLQKGKELIGRIRPDVVFCGLSTTDYGIDEAMMFWAHATRMNIPAFQFLEAAGTFNHWKDGAPVLYFGVDEACCRYSHKGALAPVEVAGSPKHEYYADLPVAEWRKNLREQFRVSDELKLIGYFGQDPELPGDLENFRALAEAVRRYQKDHPGQAEMLMRPHPAYKDKAHLYEGVLRENNVSFIDGGYIEPIEKILCACDAVVSAFSTVCVDHAYLSHYSRKPIGAVLYSVTNDDLKSFLVDSFGYWKNPFLEQGIGFCAETPGEITGRLEYILRDPEGQKKYFRATRTMVHNDRPCEKIINRVKDLVNASAKR